jgi:hypothetical protein
MLSGLLLVAPVWLAASSSPGAIEGTVVNGSANGQPAAGVEVVLRIREDGVFVPIGETTSDEKGTFSFRDLPVGHLYLPGANREGVHYPGERVLLHRDEPVAQVQLAVYDTVADPSPLVAREHEIVLRPEAGKLEVTERLLIANSSLHTYVGRITTGHMPVTLRLGVPSEFKRVTFHKEFFGRRFHLIKGHLLTTIPWTPGERELAFTYVLPVEEDYVWERTTELPCSKLRIRVVGKTAEEVTCNLPAVGSGFKGQAVFAAASALPAGQVVRVELNRLAGSFMASAKWVAVCVLATLILLGIVIVKRRSAAQGGSEEAQRSAGVGTKRQRGRRHGRARTMRAAAGE